jgi:hypothetical protein
MATPPRALPKTLKKDSVMSAGFKAAIVFPDFDTSYHKPPIDKGLAEKAVRVLSLGMFQGKDECKSKKGEGSWILSIV